MEIDEETCVNFESILCIRKHFTKFLSEHADEEYPPAFCMYAEALNERDFTSQQELSNFLEVNKAHTSRTLFKMHAKGLVRLEPKRISLTKKGKNFAIVAEENKRKYVEHLLSGVSKEDLKVLSRIVNKITENTKKMNAE